MTPDYCPFELTVIVDGIDITFDSDTQEITIPTILDLTPSNPNKDDDDDDTTEHTYPVTIKIIVTADDGSETPDEVIIPVVVKNPCVDSDFVTIEVAVFDDLEYTIGLVAETYDPHTVFLVKTKPITHSLCGVLVYEPRYNRQELDDSVLTYAEDTRKFTVNSDE